MLAPRRAPGPTGPAPTGPRPPLVRSRPVCGQDPHATGAARPVAFGSRPRYSVPTAATTRRRGARCAARSPSSSVPASTPGPWTRRGVPVGGRCSLAGHSEQSAPRPTRRRRTRPLRPGHRCGRCRRGSRRRLRCRSRQPAPRARWRFASAPPAWPLLRPPQRGRRSPGSWLAGRRSCLAGAGYAGSLRHPSRRLMARARRGRSSRLRARWGASVCRPSPCRWAPRSGAAAGVQEAACRSWDPREIDEVARTGEPSTSPPTQPTQPSRPTRPTRWPRWPWRPRWRRRNPSGCKTGCWPRSVPLPAARPARLPPPPPQTAEPDRDRPAQQRAGRRPGRLARAASRCGFRGKMSSRAGTTAVFRWILVIRFRAYFGSRRSAPCT